MAKDTKAAFDAEVSAHRKALDAYTKTFLTELGRSGWLGALAGTNHIHKTMAHNLTGNAVILTLHVEFSEILDAADVAELAAHAERDPGSVPEA